MFATVEEIAAAEQINASYVSRVLRLTLLAPDIVEAILHGRPPAGLTLAALMQPFAMGVNRTAAMESCGSKLLRKVTVAEEVLSVLVRLGQRLG